MFPKTPPLTPWWGLGLGSSALPPARPLPPPGAQASPLPRRGPPPLPAPGGALPLPQRRGLPPPGAGPRAFGLRRAGGPGLRPLPPWLKRESLERALALRLFALAPGMALAGLLDLFLKLPERALLEVLHQATGLALAHVAPWGRSWASPGPSPPGTPRSRGRGGAGRPSGRGRASSWPTGRRKTSSGPGGFWRWRRGS